MITGIRPRGYGDIFTQNMEATQNFFIKLREVENAHFDCVSNLGAELLEKMVNNELAGPPQLPMLASRPGEPWTSLGKLTPSTSNLTAPLAKLAPQLVQA